MNRRSRGQPNKMATTTSLQAEESYFADKLQAVGDLTIPEGLNPLSSGRGLDRGRGGVQVSGPCECMSQGWLFHPWQPCILLCVGRWPLPRELPTSPPARTTKRLGPNGAMGVTAKEYKAINVG